MMGIFIMPYFETYDMKNVCMLLKITIIVHVVSNFNETLMEDIAIIQITGTKRSHCDVML